MPQCGHSPLMRRALYLAVLLLGATFVGCIGSDGSETVSPASEDDATEVDWGAPIPDAIAGIEHLSNVETKGGGANGAGIWLDGDHAYVSGLGSGFHVVDVSDPQQPERVGHLDGDELYARDADLLSYPDRTVIVLATQSGGMTFVNVTDPTQPEVLSIKEDVDPNHNVAVVPNSTLVYNSPSNGEGNANQIVDASNPAKPEIVGEFGTYGCHDITFYTEDGKQRAYCAGVQTTEIWNIEDPLEPERVAMVSNPCMDDEVAEVPWSNCGGLHHTAFVNHDASILIIGDEFQGGGGPGCGFQQSVEGNSAATPLGALWFYDISDETNPELVGWFAPDVPAQRHADALTATAQDNPTATPYSMSCTSHFGDLIPGQSMLVMGWYHAGVLLIDFSDPANPVQIDQWNPDTWVWDAQVHKGFVFTGDISRGLDSLRFLPAG